MPLYEYKCRECGTLTEAFRRVARRNRAPKCECGGKTKKVFSRASTDVLNWEQTVLSDSMGVSKHQVAEHRRRHPNIPLNDEGQIVVRNGRDERNIRKELAAAFRSRE